MGPIEHNSLNSLQIQDLQWGRGAEGIAFAVVHGLSLSSSNASMHASCHDDQRALFDSFKSEQAGYVLRTYHSSLPSKHVQYLFQHAARLIRFFPLRRGEIGIAYCGSLRGRPRASLFLLCLDVRCYVRRFGSLGV